MRKRTKCATRKDGLAKVRGEARYVDDLSLDGMLFGRTVRSSIPCGAFRVIRVPEAAEAFTIADANDIPGDNVVSLIEDDQPFLARGFVRHQDEPILLLAHADPTDLKRARVEIAYDRHPAILDVLASSHVLAEKRITKGDPESGFNAADVIVEGEYRTGHQEHAYLETQGVIAVPTHDGMTIWGSMQCPYFVRRAVARMLDRAPEAVRVVQTETGGGFGGKEDYPSILAGHAALLATKSGRPVKMIYERGEDMASTTKRHPAIVRHKTGMSRRGRIVAMEIEVILDAGAYTTLSPVVLSRALIHATGPYRCDHVRVHGEARMTNTPPNGAFRGFGAPQVNFAIEVHMNRVAARLGLDPVKLRRLNILGPNDTTVTGQRLGRDAGGRRVLDEAVRRTNYVKRRASLAKSGRGLGLALSFHGAGFTGSGEIRLASKAGIELTDCGVRILASSSEIGQGSRTVHAQIVANALNIPYEDVEVPAPDTSESLDSGPTVASRTTMVVGELLRRAAIEMRRKIGRLSPQAYYRNVGPLRTHASYQAPPGVVWNDETNTGAAYGTFGWGCHVAELMIDPVTHEPCVTRMTAVMEAGTILHPVLARGQIEGAANQGLGYALTERVVVKDGRMVNPEFTNYLLPTAADAPVVEVVMLEGKYAHGPMGAKGLGELPINGVAPAIINAAAELGICATELPLTAEKVLEIKCNSSSMDAVSPSTYRR